MIAHTELDPLAGIDRAGGQTVRNVNAALAFAELGYRIFPCVKGTKEPATMHGCLDATSDPTQIEKWWAAWPEHNIGVSTDGLLLVDLDPVDDQQNPWLADESRMTELMRGACSITPRGGRHCWFRQPVGESYRSTAGKLAPGVDTRADGGYVVAPPSIVGTSYAWAPAYELTCPPGELPLPPSWLLEQIKSQRATPRTGPIAPNEICEGTRNDRLTSIAGSMRRGNMSEGMILAALRAANHERCRPMLEDEEVEKIAWSVARYEPDQVTQAVVEGWAYDAGKNSEARFAELLGNVATNAELIGRAKPPNFLVRNFMTAGTLTVWAAPEKAWKTTLGHHAALVVTGHGQFLGLYEVLTSGPVIFFSGESGDWPLKSMQERILDWSYPGGDVVFGGVTLSAKPDADSIPIFWGGDPPDLGNPGAIPALTKLISSTGAKLLILDPSQAMFGSISEDVKNDFAMRQYLKKLQLLARETGCCIAMLHHFRQHVDPGFPKRSDSSYGAFTKFCDTWILMNLREKPTGDEEAGSGKLWITWGSRDGFGASHAIDIAEGTHEAGRYFDLKVVDVSEALQEIAGKKAKRSGQEKKAVRKATGDGRKDEIRAALAGRETGVTRVTLGGILNLTSETIRPVVNAMIDTGELVDAPAEYSNRGKLCWQPGLALPETVAEISRLATARGFRGFSDVNN